MIVDDPSPRSMLLYYPSGGGEGSRGIFARTGGDDQVTKGRVEGRLGVMTRSPGGGWRVDWG